MNARVNRQPGWAMNQNGQGQNGQNPQAIPPEQAFREFDGFCQQYQGDPQAEFEAKCREMGLSPQQRDMVLKVAGRFSQMARMCKQSFPLRGNS